VSETCTGETCETFTACGPGGTCVCASTAEDTGFCVDGSTPCAGLQTCTTSDDCSAGEICAVASCCEINVCVGATFCGGANATSTAKFLFRKELDGPTIGHLYWWELGETWRSYLLASWYRNTVVPIPSDFSCLRYFSYDFHFLSGVSSSFYFRTKRLMMGVCMYPFHRNCLRRSSLDSIWASLASFCEVSSTWIENAPLTVRESLFT